MIAVVTQQFMAYILAEHLSQQEEEEGSSQIGIIRAQSWIEKGEIKLPAIMLQQPKLVNKE